MENNELKTIWETADMNCLNRSVEELDVLLVLKARKSLKKLVLMPVISAVSGLIAFVFLVYVLIDWWNMDLYFTVNTIIAIGIVLSLTMISFMSYLKMDKNDPDLSVKDLLTGKIKLMDHWVNNRLSIILTPFILFIMMNSLYSYLVYDVFLKDLILQSDYQFLIATQCLFSMVLVFIIQRKKRYHYNRLKVLYLKLCE